jgi:hypothetical protein
MCAREVEWMLPMKEQPHELLLDKYMIIEAYDESTQAPCDMLVKPYAR